MSAVLSYARRRASNVPVRARVGAPTNGVVTTPRQVGAGLALQSGAGGKAFVASPLSKGVGLAKGWGVNYANGKATGFVPPPAPAAPAVTAPAAPAATPPAPAADGTPDPRDSRYYGGLDQLAFNRDSGIADLDKQDEYAKTDLDAQIRRLAEQRTQALQQNREGANKQGLFFSTNLSKRLADTEGQFADQEGNAREGYRRGVDARVGQREGLRRNYGFEEGDLFGDAVDRAATSDLAEPPPEPAQTGQLPSGVSAAKNVSVAAGWRVVRDPITGALKFERTT